MGGRTPDRREGTTVRAWVHTCNRGAGGGRHGVRCVRQATTTRRKGSMTVRTRPEVPRRAVPASSRRQRPHAGHARRRTRRSTRPAHRGRVLGHRHGHVLPVGGRAARRRHVRPASRGRRPSTPRGSSSDGRPTPATSTARCRRVAQRQRRRRRLARLHLPRRRAGPGRLRLGGRVGPAHRRRGRRRGPSRRWGPRASGCRPEGLDPERYGDLSHPGDAFYDIYTQVAGRR